MLELTLDKRVRQYELTVLLPAALTSTELTQAIDAISALVQKHKFSVVSQEDWGKKELAYPIKKAGVRHSQAVYKHWVLEGDSTAAQSFERELYLQPQVLRHLCVIAEAAQPEQTPTKVETE